MTRQGGAAPDRLTRAGVTEREADILWAVAERLRNREIAERLHVSVRTVESHVAALLRKLGVADRAALIEAGTALRRSVRGDAPLRAPLTSLIGRDEDTSDVVELLAAHRLVTLIGPAGVGKTRLALGVADADGDHFPGGVRFADLAPVGPAMVADVLARALGVVPEPGWSLTDIWRDVSTGTACLLVVDNCEHVVADVADLVADLLAADAHLRVLATSREPLGVPGEATYPVRVLAVPTPDGSATAGSVATFDAVRLFVDRATRSSPAFVLTDAVAPAVAALCQRLDGLPLAIELAASRLRTYGPVELVEHLDQRFDLLSGGARTTDARHRTLRGAIDWSYDLLDDEERALFDRLGVFPADFDFEAVESVHRSEDRDGAAAIELLPRLVDKSLVSAVGRDTRRYRLLETLRAYAAERLAASPDHAADVRSRHAAHYAGVAEHAARGLETADQRAWLIRLDAEQSNLRTALAHTTSVGDLDTAWRLIAGLQRFWDVRGQRPEAHEWIKLALGRGDPPATPAAACGLAAASAILHPVDARAAYEIADRARQLAEGLDEITRAKAARALGISAAWVQPDLVRPALEEALAGFGDDHPWECALTMQGLAQTIAPVSEALHWGRDAVALFGQAGDQMNAANTLFIMAQRAIYAGIGDDEVQGWLSESRALAEAAGSEGDILHATVGFAQLAWLRGEHEHAAQLMDESLPALRRLGDRRCAGRATFMVGDHARRTGDLTRAEKLLRASVESVTVAGQSFVLVWALEALADVFAQQSQPRTAAVLLGTAHRARASASSHMRPPQPADEQLRRSLTRTLGQSTFRSCHTDGEALSPTEALRLAPFAEPAT